MENLETETTSMTSTAYVTAGENPGAELCDFTDGGEQYVRLLAEFDNYRRRSRREAASARDAGRQDVLLALLDVVDDFDRALSHLDGAEGAVADGFRLTHRRIEELLRSFDVSPLASEGEAFDPDFHEAVGLVEGDTKSPGSVHTEVRRGYLWKGKLLRPARVVVAR